ncbi:Hypothetical protein RMHFA_05709 [Roseomonas mucosa]|nr:Hypothetical protein RMHFA_05709 [Roseomonas mucosa]
MRASVWRCSVPGERRCLSPGPPIRQDPAGPGPGSLALADAGSRRRASLSGELPMSPARTRCFLLFGSPASPPAPRDRAAG